MSPMMPSDARVFGGREAQACCAFIVGGSPKHDIRGTSSNQTALIKNQDLIAECRNLLWVVGYVEDRELEDFPDTSQVGEDAFLEGGIQARQRFVQ